MHMSTQDERNVNAFIVSYNLGDVYSQMNSIETTIMSNSQPVKKSGPIYIGLVDLLAGSLGKTRYRHINSHTMISDKII